MTATTTILAEGRLNWARFERVEDRYGTVTIQTSGALFDGTNDPGGTYAEFRDAPIGITGRLVAHVLETRESPHIGDLFRGVFPVTPEVGERIVLGECTLFVAREDPISGDYPAIGVKPAGVAEYPWMDVEALYRAHEQTVRLEFEAVR